MQDSLYGMAERLGHLPKGTARRIHEEAEAAAAKRKKSELEGGDISLAVNKNREEGLVKKNS